MILIIFQKKKCFMKSQSWTTLTLSHLPPCNRSAWAEILGYEGTACAAKPWGHSSWLNRARKKCEVKLAVCPVRFCVCVFFLPSKIYAAAAKSLQSCPTLCNPIDGSPPGSSVPGILQTRTLEWEWQPCHFLLQCMKVKSETEVTQSCLTLCDPKDCSLPGSSVHGIFQARVLEWGAIAFSMRFMSPSCTSSLSS